MEGVDESEQKYRDSPTVAICENSSLKSSQQSCPGFFFSKALSMKKSHSFFIFGDVICRVEQKIGDYIAEHVPGHDNLPDAGSSDVLGHRAAQRERPAEEPQEGPGGQSDLDSRQNRE